MRPATPSSGGRNESWSRGSAYSTPSRKPWPADLPHHRDVPERLLELVAQAPSALAHALDEALAAKRVEDREADGAGERRAVPRVAEREAPRAVRDRLVDMFAAERRADGGVARAEPLGRRDDVRHERKAVGCEPRPRSAHAGHDLVEADQEPVLLAPLGEAGPEEVGRAERGQGGAADRLAVERRDRLRAPPPRARGRAPREPACRSGRAGVSRAGCAGSPASRARAAGRGRGDRSGRASRSSARGRPAPGR